MENSLDKFIVSDPHIAHGTPTFVGTRIMVWQVLELLEAGKNESEILEAFPTLPKGSIKAALGYAAEKAKNTTYVPIRNSSNPVLS